MRAATRSIPAVLVVTVLVASCGSAPHEATDPPPWSLTYTIDRTAGTISLPVDNFAPSIPQQHQIRYAKELVIHRCMGKANLTYTVVDRRTEPAPESRRYGIWNLSDAKRYGYALPPPTKAARAELTANSASHSKRWSDSLKECRAGDVVRKLDTQFSDVLQLGERSYFQALGSKKGGAIVAAWRKCLLAHQVQPPEAKHSTWTPERAATHPGDGKRIAVIDVSCKRHVTLVTRLVALEVPIQRKQIKKHWPQLSQQYKALKQLLKLAGHVASDPSAYTG